MSDFYSALCAHYEKIFPLTAPVRAFVGEMVLGRRRVLEVGTAKGALAGELAKRGHEVTGIDLDEEMIAAARVKEEAPNVRFQAVDMRGLLDTFSPASFDAIVCVGNTLVHLPDLPSISALLADLHRLISPGGALLLQIINYDRILDQGLDGLPTIDNEKIRFDRRYRLRGPNTPIDFETTLTVKRTGERLTQTTALYPLRSGALLGMLDADGYTSIETFGDFEGAPFEPQSSMQFVVTASAP